MDFLKSTSDIKRECKDFTYYTQNVTIKLKERLSPVNMLNRIKQIE